MTGTGICELSSKPEKWVRPQENSTKIFDGLGDSTLSETRNKHSVWYLNVLLCNEVSSFSGRVADIHTARTAYHLLLMLVGWTSHSSVRIWHVLVNVALDHTARAAQADLTSV